MRLRFEDPVATCLHAGDIIDGMRVSPQQKYVFALGQGKKREQRIIRDLLADMHTVLRMSGMDFGTEFSRESITSMWIHTALGKGVTYGEIRAILPELPRDWAFLSLVEPADIDADRECSIINRVADAINDKTVRWYVMRLRSGVSPEDITSGGECIQRQRVRRTVILLSCEKSSAQGKPEDGHRRASLSSGIAFFSGCAATKLADS